VAEAFPSERFNVYVVLSKLGEFSAEEIEHAKGLNEGFTQRAVLLSVEDLEPHLVYERARKNPKQRLTIVSFEDMVRATNQLFLTGPADTTLA
jgi:hypothetical protein